jgi:hypothetical protein
VSSPVSREHLDEVRSWVAERRLATGVLGGLLAASLVLWGGLLLATGGDRTSHLTASGTDQGGTGASGEDGEPFSSGIEEPESPPEPAPTADDEERDGERDDDADDDADDEESSRDAAAEDGDADESEGTVVLELDGACEVEVDADAEDDAATRQAWRHPECVYAPLDPTQADERWIVVVYSFSERATAEREARSRAGGSDEPRLLWSSHYPSLNPELWVVYEGPFEDRRAASEAADELGAGAYLRLLSTRGPSDETPPGR